MTKEELQKYYSREYNYAKEHLPLKIRYCIYCGSMVILNDKDDTEYYCSSCDVGLNQDDTIEKEYDEKEFEILVVNLVNGLYNRTPLDIQVLLDKTIDLCREYNDYTNDCVGCPLSKSNNGFNIPCRDFMYKYPSRFEGLIKQWMNKNYTNSVEYFRELIHDKKSLLKYTTNKFNRQFADNEMNNLKLALATSRLKGK